jgi:hypothetical protein
MIKKEATKFGSGLKNLNPILREQLLFPYYGGLYFVREVLLAHGWEGMKAVYADPPRSTEQIMHPEKYLKVRDDPKKLPKVKLNFVENAEHKLVLENTLGELGTLVLLQEHASKKKAAAGAEGWGNDRYWVFEKTGEKNRFPFVWMTVWDSELDAAEFCALVQKREKKRHRRKKNFVVRIEQKENYVAVVEGFSPELTAKIYEEAVNR